MGMIMNGLMLHLVQKVVVGMANKYNTKCNDVRYHICNIKQHNSARTTRKATIVARYKQYAYTCLPLTSLFRKGRKGQYYFVRNSEVGKDGQV